MLCQIIKRLVDQRKQEAHKVHPGLQCFKEGVKVIPIESIPGIRETGWKPSARNTRVSKVSEESADPDTLMKSFKIVLNSVSSRFKFEPFPQSNFFSFCFTNKLLFQFCIIHISKKFYLLPWIGSIMYRTLDDKSISLIIFLKKFRPK